MRSTDSDPVSEQELRNTLQERPPDRDYRAFKTSRRRPALLATDDGYRGSTVIDKGFLTGLAELAHGALLTHMPAAIRIAELRVVV